MKKLTVLGAGLVAIDHIFLAKDKRSIGATFLGSTGGGSTSNTLTLLALLGFQCSLFGILGNDGNSYLVKQDLQQYGVSSKYLKSRGTSNKVVHTREYSHIIYENRKHEFLEKCKMCGSTFRKEYQISLKDLSKDIIESASRSDIFVVDRANEATLKLADIVKKRNGSVSYDLNFVSYGRYLSNILEMIKKTDMVKTNKHTILELLKLSQVADIQTWKLQFPNLKYLFITDESNGVDCYFRLDGVEHFTNLPAVENEFVNDSGGAGDVFHAICIEELFSSDEPGNIDEFIAKIHRAQALASISCSLYGSRSLQRYFLMNHFAVTDIINYADVIGKVGKIKTPLQPNIGIPKYSLDMHVFEYSNVCKACGHSLQQQNGKTKSAIKSFEIQKQVNNAFTGIPMAMLNGFQSALELKGKLSDLLKMNAIFVGSGGSFSAATFGEYLFLKGIGKLAKAVTPYELEGWTTIPANTCIWLISHGGSNTDILGVALHLEKMLHKEVIIITGNRNSKLTEIADRNSWEVILIPSQERNFVSTVGLLSQTCALTALLSKDEEKLELNNYFNLPFLNKILKSYQAEAQTIVGPMSHYFRVGTSTHLVAFARGWGFPSLVDLESKIIEGGICTIEISELKNYTHGRWINLYGKEGRVIVMYETPQDEEIIEFFVQKFRNIPCMRLRTQYSGQIGSVDLLLKTLLVVNIMGKFSKLNILRPIFPKEGRGLHSWEPKLRRGHWSLINKKIKDTYKSTPKHLDD